DRSASHEPCQRSGGAPSPGGGPCPGPPGQSPVLFSAWRARQRRDDKRVSHGRRFEPVRASRPSIQEASMASATASPSSPASFVAPRWDRKALHHLSELWRAYWIGRARRASVVLLSSLDDRTLADIGLARSEIEWAVCDKSRRGWCAS